MENQKQKTGKAVPLANLPVGRPGVIVKNEIGGQIESRFRTLGFIEGEKITKTGVAPLGDPCAYLVGGAIFAVRKKEASRITARFLE